MFTLLFVNTPRTEIVIGKETINVKKHIYFVREKSGSYAIGIFMEKTREDRFIE